MATTGLYPAMIGNYDRAEMRAIAQFRERLSQERQEDVVFAQAADEWEREEAVEWRAQRMAHQMARQREEILRHKWIESEKAQRDLGADAVFDWIRKYAAQWRRWYLEEYEAGEDAVSGESPRG